MSKNLLLALPLSLNHLNLTYVETKAASSILLTQPIYIWIWIYMNIYIYINIYEYKYIYIYLDSEFLRDSFGPLRRNIIFFGRAWEVASVDDKAWE